MKSRRYFCLLLIFSILILLNLSGCKSKAKSGLSYLGDIRWKYVLDDGEVLDIQCYLFPQSEGLAKLYDEQQRVWTEIVENTGKRSKRQDSIRLRELYAESIAFDWAELKLKVSSWDCWPYIIVTRLLLEDSNPSKFISICRYDEQEFDIVFTMVSESDIDDWDALMAVRVVTAYLEIMPDEEWANMPVEDKPVIDEAGELVSNGKLDTFMSDTVFLEQN